MIEKERIKFDQLKFFVLNLIEIVKLENLLEDEKANITKNNNFNISHAYKLFDVKKTNKIDFESFYLTIISLEIDTNPEDVELFFHRLDNEKKGYIK